MTETQLSHLDGYFGEIVGVPQFGCNVKLELVGVLNRILSQTYQIDSSLPSTLVVSLEHNATPNISVSENSHNLHGPIWVILNEFYSLLGWY